MNILVTGSAGLIGSALISYLSGNQHRVVRLVRHAQLGTDEIYWNPAAGILDPQDLEGLEAVVHLAGESIASGRWTKEKKRRIRESRLQGTQLLAQSLARLFDPPKVLVSVSAVGYYGDRGDEQLDEDSKPGTGFLAELCRQWEWCDPGCPDAWNSRGNPPSRHGIEREGWSAGIDAACLPPWYRRKDRHRPSIHELDSDRGSGWSH